MKKIFILLIGLLLVINLVSALECQYSEDVYKTETKDIFYEEGIKLDYTLIEFTDFKEGIVNPYWPWMNVNTQFKVINNHRSKKIDLEVLFTKNGNLDSQNVSIDPLGYTIVSRSNFDNIDFNSIRYNFLNEDFMVKSENVKTLVNTTCKICNGKTCLNAGISCVTPQECGGGYCVESHCSNSESCFNNDCKCASDEIQCDDNKRCVKKSIVPIDVKPECNKPQECITGFIESKTGLCAKSLAQIHEEENQRLTDELVRKEKERSFLIYAILSLVFIVLFGMVVILYLKNKHEKEKQSQQTAA